MKQAETGSGPKWRGLAESLAVKCCLFLQVISVGTELNPRQQAENFLQMITKKNIDKAYEELLAGSIVLQTKGPQLQQIRNEFKAAAPTLGKPMDFELVSEKPAGTCISHLTYLLRFEQQPLICDFYFYRPHEHWMIDQLTIDPTFAAPGTRPAPKSAAKEAPAKSTSKGSKPKASPKK